MNYVTEEQRLEQLEADVAAAEGEVASAEANVADYERLIASGATDPLPSNTRVADAAPSDAILDFDTDSASFDKWREAFDAFEANGYTDCFLDIDEGGTDRYGDHTHGSVALCGLRLRTNKEELALRDQQLTQTKAKLIRLRNARDEIDGRVQARMKRQERADAEAQVRNERTAEIIADPEYNEFARLNAKFTKKGMRSASFR